MLLVTLLPTLSAQAEAEQVRVLLSTGSKSSLTLELFGSYTFGDTTMENGTLIVKAEGSKVTLTHSKKGTLYSGTGEGVLSQTGEEKGYVTLATASDKVRKYTGSMTFYAEDGIARAVNTVSMSDYICGVAVPEVGRDADENILKVALLTAKGFALAELKPKKKYDVRDTTSDQLYYGYFPDADRVLAAAEEVGDMTLLYEGKVVKTHYGSANGGVILTPKNRWGGTAAYEGAYQCKYDPFDLLGSEKNYVYPIDGTHPETMNPELYTYLNEQSGGTVTAVVSVEGYNTLGNDSRYPAAYAPQNGVKLTVQTEAGEKNLDIPFSTLQEVLNASGSITFATRVGEDSWRLCFGNSSGPRVGVSHRGAAVMTNMGYDYVDILTFYYPGAQLTAADGTILSSNKDLSPEGILSQITGENNGYMQNTAYVMEETFLLQSTSDSTSNHPALKLQAGQAVGLYKKSGSYYRCMDLTTGVVGYVPASLLSSKPVGVPVPTESPKPTATPEPTQIPLTPEPPVPTDTPVATETPAPADTPVPMETPTATPEATASAEPTSTPEPAVTPTEAPVITPAPVDTPAPAPTAEPTQAPTQAPTEEPLRKGDADGDGAVTVQDAALLLRYIVGLETLLEERLTLLDVDGDGSITAADAARILQYVVGLIPEL